MHSYRAVRKHIGELSARTRAGHGGALLVRAPGPPGAPAFLEEAAARFEGTVLHARGVRAEQEVPFSGLHALLRPVTGLLTAPPAAAPPPYCSSLATALRLENPVPRGGEVGAPDRGASSGPGGSTGAGDTGAVLAETLTFVSRLAAREPLLCCVENVELLDEASSRVLGFVARRLGRSLPVAVLLGTDPTADHCPAYGADTGHEPRFGSDAYGHEHAHGRVAADDGHRGLLPLAGLPVVTPVPGLDELHDGFAELRGGPLADARETLHASARLLTPYAPHRAGAALLGAAEASFGLGDTDGYRSAVARLAALPTTRQDPLLECYASGMSALMRGRAPHGVPALRRTVGLAVHEHEPERLLLGAVAGLVLGEVTAARETGTRALAAARSQGPPALVPRVLEILAYGELRTGCHDRAAAHARAGLVAALRTGQRNLAAHLHAVLAMAAAVRGAGAECARHAEAAGVEAGPNGLGIAATLAQWSLARCDLLHGRAHEAALRLRPLVRGHPGPAGRRDENRPGQGHFTQRMLAVPCFVEAAVRAGRPEWARASVAGFVLWTSVTADPQAPAQLARCQALLADPAEAGPLYRRALAAHDRCEGGFERARTQFLYGAFLRRQRRPSAARGVLREARFAFEQCGALSSAAQAGDELRATGAATGTVASYPPAAPTRTGSEPGTGSGSRSGSRSGPGAPGAAFPYASRTALPGGTALAALTPQQLRVARHVAQGATNREVAVRLSVSPRTVDHHLRNVFSALGVRSRVELTRVLTEAEERS